MNNDTPVTNEEQLKNWQVLVVEDDEQLLWAITERLRSEGFNVTGTTSCAEGLAKLQQRGIRVLITDWELGGKDNEKETTGRTLLKACEQIDPLIWTLVISGVTYIDVRSDSIGANADLFFAKPFGLEIVVSTLKRWFYRDAMPPAPSTAASEVPFKFNEDEPRTNPSMFLYLS